MSSFLVRAPNWIGDQILAYPFFYYLRKTFPKAKIGVCCVPWVKDLQFLNLVNEIYVLDVHKNDFFYKKIQKIEASAKIMKAQGPWDEGICLPRSLGAAWSLARAQVKRLRGYAGEGRSWLLDECVPWVPGKHRAEEYVFLLPQQAQRFSRESFWKNPEMSFSPQKTWLSQSFWEPPQEKFWILAPGSQAESRRWPIEQFSQLAQKIYEETGWRGLILGGAQETSLARYCLQKNPGLLDWTNRGPITRYAELFQAAQFTVANDSGLAHFAALCGSFVQVIWGAGQESHTRPLGPGRVQVITNPVECWPCEKNHCSQKQSQRYRCLTGISVEAVWEAIRRGLGDESRAE